MQTIDYQFHLEIDKNPENPVNPTSPVKSFVENKQREFNWGQKLFMDRFLR
jgi:hypothetical protein